MRSTRFDFERWATAALFAGGYVLLYRRWLFTGFDATFGDEGDGLIALAIIEHWHRVLLGVAHWTDPTFFFPEPGALGFTDAYFLYGAACATLRGLGFDLFTSLMLVMSGLSALGYFGFVRLARRRFAIPMLWASVGAFLFAFANVDAVKLIHVQIYCAMVLPLTCELALAAWASDSRRRGAALAAAAGLLHAVVMFTAYQVGWFFTFFLLIFAMLHLVIGKVAETRELLRAAATTKRHVLLAYAGAFAIALVPFLWLYVPVLMTGLSRDFAEVLSNAPDWTDLLNVTPHNVVWGEVLRHVGVTGRPARPVWEVELAFTPGVLTTMFAALVMLALRRGRSYSDTGLLVLGIGVIVVWLLQLDIGGLRLWKAVWALVPGAGGIRYIFRSQVVANLFVALIAAKGLAELARATNARGLSMLALAVGVFLLVEQVNDTWPATISRRATIAWLNAAPPAPNGCRAFYLAPDATPLGKPGWEHQADAMLFSQLRGVPTVNGYSSWLPRGWNLENLVDPGYPEAVRNWTRDKGVRALCGLDPRGGRWTTGLP